MKYFEEEQAKKNGEQEKNFKEIFLKIFSSPRTLLWKISFYLIHNKLKRKKTHSSAKETRRVKEEVEGGGSETGNCTMHSAG